MKRLIGLLALSTLLVSSALAGWSMESENAFPILNKPMEISISSDEGLDCQRAVLNVIYRPNSKTERKETVGSPAFDCKLSWTPKNPGITILSLTYEDKEVIKKQISTRFDRTPVLGILVLVAAGCILYGGIIYSMKVAIGQREIK